MLPHGKTHAICIPYYKSQDSYNAFLALMTAEGRAMTRPWAETQALQNQLGARDSFQGVPVVLVPVNASRWEQWCDSRRFGYSPETVSCYATWLHLGAVAVRSIATEI